MVNYYVEIATRINSLGESLWAADGSTWHWKMLKELKKGDVVYHFHSKGDNKGYIGKSIVSEPYKIVQVTEELKRSFPKYTNIKQIIVVKLTGYEGLKKPVFFDQEFYNKLDKLEYDRKYGPFTRPPSSQLSEAYCARLDPKLKVFLDNYQAIAARPLHSSKILPKLCKQLILYGPPGTGKTWKTKQIAFKILGDDDD